MSYKVRPAALDYKRYWLIHCLGRLTRWSYADDFKLVADVTECSKAEVQSDVEIVARWSDEHHMPFSCDKYGVTHCGCANPDNTYCVYECPMAEIVSFKDISFVRSHDGGYAGHCQTVAVKASQLQALLGKFSN